MERFTASVAMIASDEFRRVIVWEYGDLGVWEDVFFLTHRPIPPYDVDFDAS